MPFSAASALAQPDRTIGNSASGEPHIVRPPLIVELEHASYADEAKSP